MLEHLRGLSSVGSSEGKVESVHEELASEINSCRYVYLRELGEPQDNSLRVVIEEAVVNSATLDADGPQSEYGPIESTLDCRLYELRWETYISYGVTNESFALSDDTEEYTGRLFRNYSRSHFLEYVRMSTFASEEYPGPAKHFSLVCLNHIVDVIGVDVPTIRRLRPKPSEIPLHII